MKHLTYEDWIVNGRHVIKGEVSTERNKRGEPVFSYEQTEESYERASYTDQYFYCGD